MYALIKKIAEDTSVAGGRKLGNLCLLPTLAAAEEAMKREVDAVIKNILNAGKGSDEFTVTTHEGAYAKIEAGNQMYEWIISTNVSGHAKHSYAVVCTYSWALDDPYATSVELFETEGDAMVHLAESYRAEKDSDQENGYTFECSIEANAKWAEIVNHRRSGDIDHTEWMRFVVTRTIPLCLRQN